MLQQMVTDDKAEEVREAAVRSLGLLTGFVDDPDKFNQVFLDHVQLKEYYAPQVWPDRGLNSWPPDHDSTFHVTETPALTTWPSVTSALTTWPSGTSLF